MLCERAKWTDAQSTQPVDYSSERGSNMATMPLDQPGKQSTYSLKYAARSTDTH